MRRLPLVDLLVDTKTELSELALRSGLKVLTTMLEEDRTAAGRGMRTSPSGRQAAQSAPLAGLDLVALPIDGVHLSDHAKERNRLSTDGSR